MRLPSSKTPLVLALIAIIALAAILFTRPGTAPAGSLAVAAPAADEAWQNGTTHTIAWTTENVPAGDKVAVTIRRIPPPPLQTEGQEFDPIVFTNLPDTGSATWTISAMYPPGTYVLGVSAYASVPVRDEISGESAQFRIEPQPLSQALYPLYSNAGITWQAPRAREMNIGTTTIAGTAIDALAATSTMNPGAAIGPFQQYYRGKLLAAGWRIDNMLEAGGPMGGQTGYRKGSALILVNFTTTFHNVSPNAPVQCPCDVTLTLFSTTR